jgi:SAM-dependent methyltransferase
VGAGIRRFLEIEREEYGMASIDNIEKLYDESFDKYAKSNQGAENAAPGGMAAVRACVETPSFLKAVGNIQGKRVLDAGCGEGKFSRTYRQTLGASKVVGVDLSAGLVAAAVEREERERLGIQYGKLDLSERDERLVGQFDFVASAMVLMHIPTREALEAAARNFYAYLDPKTGGRLLAEFVQVEFDVTERDPEWESRYGWVWSKPANGRTYDDGECADVDITFDPKVGPIHLTAHMWRKKTYEDALKKAGFSNVRWIKPELFEDNVREIGLTNAFFEPLVRLGPIWIISAEKRATT